MSTWLRQKNIPTLVFFFISICSVFLNPHFIHADHASPERVVDNTYVVILLPTFSEKGEAELRFIFRDIQTGKNISAPIRFFFTIQEADTSTPLFVSEKFEIVEGVGVASYQFPHQGIYELQMEFEKVDESGKIYRPDNWSLWVPGAQTNRGFYPIGYTEIAGFGLLSLAAFTVVVTKIWNKTHVNKP